MSAATAALVRPAAVASPLPRGGARLFSSLTRPCAPVPKSTRPSPPSFLPRRRLHEGASTEELKRVEARLTEELKGVQARLTEELKGVQARVEGNAKEVVARLERHEVETSGKLFKVEVVATDTTGKVLAIKEAQSKQEDSIEKVTSFLNYESRLNTDRYAHLHGCHTQLLVQMSSTTYRLVISACAGFATLSLGGLQIYSLVSKNNEKLVDARVDARVDAKLKENLEMAVEKAIDQKIAEAQGNDRP